MGVTMSEVTEVIQWILKFLLIGVYGSCWIIGGRSGTPKAIRRLLGALLFGGGIILFSFWQGQYSHLLLLYPLALFICSSFGYGASSIWNKIRRRSIFGIAMGLTSLPVAIVTGSWQLFIIQFCLALFASVIFGVLNPFSGSGSAVYEEGTIGVFSIFLVPYMLGGACG